MTKEDLSITYENNIFYCTKNNTKWISVDGEKWYGDEKRITELEAQIEKMKCLNEEIIKALNECLDYEWLHAHNGRAKYLYLQTVIDIVNEKFKEIKENDKR